MLHPILAIKLKAPVVFYARVAKGALFSILLMAGGCAPHYRYYRLQTEVPRADHASEHTMGVRAVDLPGWLNTPRLSWAHGGVQVFRSPSAFWGGDLAGDITYVLAENMSRQYHNMIVTMGPWLPEECPDRVVCFDLDNVILEPWGVAVVACWRVVNPHGSILAQRAQRTWSAQINQSEPGARLAQGLSEILAEVTMDVISGLNRNKVSEVKSLAR